MKNLLLAAAEHALDRETDGRNGQCWTPLVIENTETDVSVGINLFPSQYIHPARTKQDGRLHEDEWECFQ
jgi:hypothetical protein